MNKDFDIFPLKGESPSSFAERLGFFYSARATEVHKKKHGQYFTPPEIAQFMASLCGSRKKSVKILDPGCGTGILSCAIVEALINKERGISEIDLIAYETDSKIVHSAQLALAYLKDWTKSHNVQFSFRIFDADFVLSNSDILENQGKPKTVFDIVIANPPYFKLQKSDYRAKAGDSIVHGQPNIYSIFLYTAATILSQDGQLIFITPRSFTSGYYFRLFREKFFSLVQLDTIHLFNSRKEMFKKDAVLQENIIISAYRRNDNKYRQKVILSFSQGLKDINQIGRAHV